MGRTHTSPALISPDQPVSLTSTKKNTRPVAPKDPLPYLNNSAIEMSRANKNGAALLMLNRVWQVRPSDTIAYNRALVLGKLKRLEEAAILLSGQPSFAHAQLNLGLLQCRMGQW
ncbi:MAG: hypothetical protein LH609_21490 [Rudanella sp.]|nr:hypothetical protein [Rudanella sp.]